jgi:hypothetical protein
VKWFVVLMALVAVSCGSTSVTDPAQAQDCTELVEAGRAVAERVLERLEGQTLSELEAADPETPFAPIERLMRSDEFTQRAVVLGCGTDQLRLQACSVYADLEFDAQGELARDFLAPYLAACD